MTTDYTELALDADGIPILTDLVQEDGFSDSQATATVEPLAVMSPQQLTRELLASDAVRQQINQIADALAQDVRLRIEQTLAAAIDAAINNTLEQSHTRTRDSIRRQLDDALTQLVSQALQASNH